jgi:uncharacterized protein YceK
MVQPLLIHFSDMTMKLLIPIVAIACLCAGCSTVGTRTGLTGTGMVEGHNSIPAAYRATYSDIYIMSDAFRPNDPSKPAQELDWGDRTSRLWFVFDVPFSLTTDTLFFPMDAAWLFEHRDRSSANEPIEPYYFVGGWVNKRGRYDWTARVTVVDAIKAAGGVTESGGRQISISHRGGNSESLDWDTLAATNKPPRLRRGDYIYVPKKPHTE